MCKSLEGESTLSQLPLLPRIRSIWVETECWPRDPPPHVFSGRPGATTLSLKPLPLYLFVVFTRTSAVHRMCWRVSLEFLSRCVSDSLSRFQLQFWLWGLSGNSTGGMPTFPPL